MMKKRVLYTGLEPDIEIAGNGVFHLPMISMEMRSVGIKEIQDVFQKIYGYSHILFPSKYAVISFFRCMEKLHIPKDHLEPVYLLAIGMAARGELEKHGVNIHYVGSDETEEGVIRLLDTLDLEDANVLLPQAGITRPKLIHYLVERGVNYEVIILYDLLKEAQQTRVNLDDFDEIVFTSPVGVDAFFEQYEDIPPNLEVQTMGLATRCQIKKRLTEERDQNHLIAK